MLKNFIKTMPHFKGKFRLLKVLFKAQLKSSTDVILKGKYGLQYKIPNLKEIIGFEIFVNGIYEKETSDLILNRLPENGIFIDVGANIGSISLPVCKSRPDVKAICIEASSKIYSYLLNNVKLNNIENCILVNKIIWNKDDVLLNFFAPVELFGKGSVSPVFTNVAESVKSITIDTLISQLGITNVHVIKIDIEGYEYFAFKGAENLLRQDNAPDILFEFLDGSEDMVEGINAGDAQKLLLSFGYKLYSIEKKSKFSRIDVPCQKGEKMILATKNKL